MTDCEWAAAHGPAPTAGQDWSPCIGCGTPQAILPPSPWPDDLWRFLVEPLTGGVEIDLTDDDGNPITERISGGAAVIMVMRLGERLRRSGYTVIREWELDEMRSRSASAATYPWPPPNSFHAE